MASEHSRISKNIQDLRKSFGLTQQEFAKKFSFGKSTISELEKGINKPRFDTLKIIAFRLGIPVDILINGDFSNVDLSKADFNWEDATSIDEIPIVKSAKALKNVDFAEGYRLTQEILASSKRGEASLFIKYEKLLDSYTKAYEESNIIEAAGNILWFYCSFYVASFNKQVINATKDLMNRKITGADFVIKHGIKADDACDEDNEKNRRNFVLEVNGDAIKYIKALKNSPNYSSLAEYYAALRYRIDMVDTDYGTDFNMAIGTEMMQNLVILGNLYAIEYMQKLHKMLHGK